MIVTELISPPTCKLLFKHWVTERSLVILQKQKKIMAVRCELQPFQTKIIKVCKLNKFSYQKIRSSQFPSLERLFLVGIVREVLFILQKIQQMTITSQFHIWLIKLQQIMSLLSVVSKQKKPVNAVPLMQMI